MKRLGRSIILALMTATLLLPGLAGTASAQDAAALCNQANEGASVDGYTIVYGSGGAGSQIVLSDGTGSLSGGSGSDILCAWGGDNTLEGGSGNDILIVMSGTRNALYGGSGNDTMIGLVNDTFDGGSGRNQQVVIQLMDLMLGDFNNSRISFSVQGSGFTPGATVDIIVDYYDQGDQFLYSDSVPGLNYPIVDSNGNFSTWSETGPARFGFFGCSTYPGGQEFAYMIITATENNTGNSREETFTQEETCFE